MGRGAIWLVVAAAVLAGCGSEQAGAPDPGSDGLVDATPRALASIVVEHVHPGEPRRTTGSWSDWNDPPALEAQVDFGVDPEGSEDGESRTVRIDVADLAAFSADDRRGFECRAEDEGRCESEKVGDDTVLYRWYPGMEEEEPGSYGWTVLRDDEVVTVSYDGSGLFDVDPRTLDLPVDPEDLRVAALDPAMSLRTTPEAWEAGAALDSYQGVERRPRKPEIVPTTPRQLAARVEDYLGIKPSSVGPSRLDDLGPDAAGAHLELKGTRTYDPLTIDVLTAIGRAPQLDPLPCPVQRSGRAAELGCFSWGRDSAATWTLAHGDSPGVLWIYGAQEDDKFNRVESVAIRVESTGIVAPFFTERGYDQNRVPRDLLSLEPMTSDLSIGPETATTD